MCGTTLYLDRQLSLCFWSGRISCKRYDSGKNVLDIHWTSITTFFFTRRLFNPTIIRPDVIANLRTPSREMCNFRPILAKSSFQIVPYIKFHINSCVRAGGRWADRRNEATSRNSIVNVPKNYNNR